MLQQTQVNAVIPYYNHWMKSFPNLQKLSRSPLARVLKCWEGLGYYSRARNIHKTAKIVLRKFGGKFPDSRGELQSLPGIGRYTAGAIASIAFNRPEPIVDGNVKRVLARVFALKEGIDSSSGEKKLWEISKKLVETAEKAAGDFNQSLMELGALVCMPENPKCFSCPLKKICNAHQLNREAAFPIKIRKTKTERLRTVAAVIWKDGRILLEKQPLHARWGGLWLFPQWTHKNGKSEKALLVEKLRKNLDIYCKDLRHRMDIEHGFTKYRVRLSVFEGRDGFQTRSRTRRAQSTLRWIKPEKISALPFPSPHQKIAQEILNRA